MVPVEADAGRNLGGEHALIEIFKRYRRQVLLRGRHQRAGRGVLADQRRAAYAISDCVSIPTARAVDSPFRRIKVEVTKKDAYGKPVSGEASRGTFHGAGEVGFVCPERSEETLLSPIPVSYDDRNPRMAWD